MKFVPLFLLLSTNLLVVTGTFWRRREEPQEKCTDTVCEGSWVGYNGHCYSFLTTTQNWYDSKKLCEGEGAYLARVETVKENNWLQHQLLALSAGNVESYFLGGNNLLGGTWYWESNVDAIVYENWKENEPSSTNNLCLRFEHDGDTRHFWDTHDCASTSYAICEADQKTLAAYNKRNSRSLVY